jgi:glycerol-3-phosphate acyltransferase PlsY
MHKGIAPPGFADEKTPMPLLDLLGNLFGAAFLSGSVALAVIVDRREAAKEERLPGAEAPAASPAPRVVDRKLRLVPAIDR